MYSYVNFNILEIYIETFEETGSVCRIRTLDAL
jgi:hypothetical protein